MAFELQFVLDEFTRRTPDDPKLVADPMVQAVRLGDRPTLLPVIDTRGCCTC